MTTAGDATCDDRFTIDAFHRGRYHLVQPAAGGHRAGMDAMMLAAAVPTGFAGRLVDLGAGAGAAGLGVAARCDGAAATLVERDAQMADCARRSLALDANSHLRGRGEVIEADVTLNGTARRAAGLQDASFDFAIMNPPFNAPHDRMSPHSLRAGAHVMAAGMFEAWLRTAAAIVRPRGGLAVIARPVSLAELLGAIEGRFGDAEIIPIHARPGQPAIRLVLRARRGSRGALSLHSPIMLHHGEGNGFTDAAEAMINGRASLMAD